MITIDKCYERTLDGKRIELSCENITDKEIIEVVIPYLKQHPQIKEVRLTGNQIKNKGVRALAVVETIEALYLDANPISEKGAKALASNVILHQLGISRTDKDFELYDDPKIMAIAYEEDPLKKANYGREVRITTQVPSLKKLLLFKKYINKEELTLDLQDDLENMRNAPSRG